VEGRMSPGCAVFCNCNWAIRDMPVCVWKGILESEGNIRTVNLEDTNEVETEGEREIFVCLFADYPLSSAERNFLFFPRTALPTSTVKKADHPKSR